MHRCLKCGQPWDDSRAQDNELTCTRRCGGQLVLVEPVGLLDLEGCDRGRLPYPVALTAHRLKMALERSNDVLKTLFLLKDCFEATIKYLGAVLLSEYRQSPACTPEHSEVLLRSMVKPSLGHWVNHGVRPLSLWLSDQAAPPGGIAAAMFAEQSGKPGSKPAESALMQRCQQFVTFRNDALGHGAQRRDDVYESDLAEWLPLVRHLLDGVATLAAWRICLVVAEDRCQVWLGPEPGNETEPGQFSTKEVGHFILLRHLGASRDLYPFICYVPDSRQEKRLRYYDSLYRYKASKKEATVLEYDHGDRHPRAEPIEGMEEAFTADLLAKAFDVYRNRMVAIEGRFANYGEFLEQHAAIVGRSSVIEHVRNFLTHHDRGLLVIEAQPGKGKTALMAHLIEKVFDQHAPSPVHYFYRRTAGITDPAVCVRSLYYSLLDVHGITEAEESKQKNSPDEMYVKLINLLTKEIAPRLLPGRPQLLFIDALDEASGNAFQRIPENLPVGVYIIAATRPVSNRVVLARRQHFHWYDLDSPDLLHSNISDGFDYAEQQLAGTDLTHGTLREIARIGAGNFLVLKLLCQHLRATLRPDQIAPFLSRLATDGGKDQLGFIYAEFWERLTHRCTPDEVNLLCKVAGAFVTADAPLTAEVVCGVLCLRPGEWDFALRRLAEYLTVVDSAVDDVREKFYRSYHESFADFLRDKVKVGNQSLRSRFADFCRRWEELEGYPRTYALRFGPRHLVGAGRAEEGADLLMSPRFKVRSGMVFGLVTDLDEVRHELPGQPACLLLELLHEALQREANFIARRPSTLFQCMWNLGWWYDCPHAHDHYNSPEDGWSASGPPWERPGPKLYRLLEEWQATPTPHPEESVWVRSLRPPKFPLGAGGRMVDRETEQVRGISRIADYATSVVFTPDVNQVAVALHNHTIELISAAGTEGVPVLRGRAGFIQAIAFAPTGGYVATGHMGGQVQIWDLPVGRTRQGGVQARHAFDGAHLVAGRAVGCGSRSRDDLLYLGHSRSERRMDGCVPFIA